MIDAYEGIMAQNWCEQSRTNIGSVNGIYTIKAWIDRYDIVPPYITMLPWINQPFFVWFDRTSHMAHLSSNNPWNLFR